MRTISKEELEKILENHRCWCERWLQGKANYKDEMRANLSWTDLSRTDLSGSNLSGANLSGANLSEADLCDADIYKAIVRRVKALDSAHPMACPDIGSFIGWKKACVEEFGDIVTFKRKRTEVIIKLQIPEHAKRLSATGRKCRCDEAKVLDIQSLDGKSLPEGTIAHSKYDYSFTYEIGKTVKVNDFDDNRWNECSAGIHFFITRQEAVDYYF